MTESLCVACRPLKNLWRHFKRRLAKRPTKFGSKRERTMQARDVSTDPMRTLEFNFWKMDKKLFI